MFVTLENRIFEYLTRYPGAEARQVADGLRVGASLIASQLRGQEGRMFCAMEGRWYPIPAADPAAALVVAGSPQLGSPLGSGGQEPDDREPCGRLQQLPG